MTLGASKQYYTIAVILSLVWHWSYHTICNECQ